MNILAVVAMSVSLAAVMPGVSVTAMQGANQDKTAPAPAQEHDPICGMSVDPAKAKAAGRTSEYQGKTYYFCNDSCKKQFDADPAKHAQKPSGEKTASPSGCCCHARESAPASGGGMCCRRS